MKDFYWLFCSVCFLLFHDVEGDSFKWSSSEYESQAKKYSCKNFELKKQHQLKNGNNAGNLTKLGKVKDIEVCGILCCEVESCDLAFLENEFCYSVTCLSLDSCETEHATDNTSEILTMGRKSGSDIWTRGSHDSPAASIQSKIVTKQAAVQKTVVPDKKPATSNVEQKSSVTVISKIDSPMDALLQKETAMIKDKQNKENKKDSVSPNSAVTKPNVGQKIQDITSEHYLKAEEKSDMTALQENETSTMHPVKTQHRHKDLRHTLISPITIGAFTCMAVIAVSGFAMAIIKYNRERKDYEDKTTQKP